MDFKTFKQDVRKFFSKINPENQFVPLRVNPRSRSPSLQKRANCMKGWTEVTLPLNLLSTSAHHSLFRHKFVQLL